MTAHYGPKHLRDRGKEASLKGDAIGRAAAGGTKT